MKITVELEKDDCDALRSTIFDALELENLTDSDVLEYWNKIPKDIKSEAIHWGLYDTPTSESIYTWLIETYS